MTIYAADIQILMYTYILDSHIAVVVPLGKQLLTLGLDQ